MLIYKIHLIEVKDVVGVETFGNQTGKVKSIHANIVETQWTRT